jgi:hypothetical protein
MGILFGLFALSAMSNFQGGSVAPPQPVDYYQTMTLDDALTRFDSFCVTPMPNPEAFVQAMNTSDIRWHLVASTPSQVRALGNAWRSRIGQISYHRRQPDDRLSQAMGSPDPGCHYEFRVASDYSHATAAAEVERHLGLGRPCTRNRARNQTRWERADDRGFSIRVFLSSETNEIGLRGARLSISRLSVPSEDASRQTIDLQRCR